MLISYLNVINTYIDCLNQQFNETIANGYVKFVCPHILSTAQEYRLSVTLDVFFVYDR